MGRREYLVKWGSGSLGISLHYEHGLIVVGRITKADSAAARANVEVGHLLVMVNKESTNVLGYEETVKLLKVIKRPANLTFQVPDHRSSSSMEYVITWKEGPLGMVLGEDDTNKHLPAIRKITGRVRGGHMEKAKVGDILVAVDGEETAKIGFRSSVALLKNRKKPVELSFRRRKQRGEQTTSRNTNASAAPRTSPKTTTNTSSSLYTVTWKGKELGMKLTSRKDDTPQVSRLTGVGDTTGLEKVDVGDVLVTINDESIKGQNYKDTLRQLKHTPKPAFLQFRKSTRSTRGSIVSANSSQSDKNRVSKAFSAQDHKRRKQYAPQSVRSIAEEAPRGPSPEELKLQEEKEERYRAKEEKEIRRAARDKRKQAEKVKRHAEERAKRKEAREKAKAASRRPKRAPLTLDVAKQLVAKDRDLDTTEDEFEGIPFSEITEDTSTAVALRRAATAYLDKEDDLRKKVSSNALSRAEHEGEILAQALERVQENAREVEQAMNKQAILHKATKKYPKEILAHSKDLISQLQNKIIPMDYSDDGKNDFDRRDAEEEFQYGEEDGSGIETNARQSMRLELQDVIKMNKDDVQVCGECGIHETEGEGALELDDDGECYCTDCWDQFYNKDDEVPLQKQKIKPLDLKITPSSPGQHGDLSSLAARSDDSEVDLKALKREVNGIPEESDAAKEAQENYRHEADLMDQERVEALARFRAHQRVAELKSKGINETKPDQNTPVTIGDDAIVDAKIIRRRAEEEDDERRQALERKVENRRRGDFHEKPLPGTEVPRVVQKRPEARKVPSPTVAKSEVSEEFKPASERSEDMEEAPDDSSEENRPANAKLEEYENDDGVGSEKSEYIPTGKIRDHQVEELSKKLKTTKLASEESEPLKQRESEDMPPPMPVQVPNSDHSSSDSDAEEAVRRVESRNIALAQKLEEAQKVVDRARMSILIGGEDKVEESLVSPVRESLNPEQVKLLKNFREKAEDRASFVNAQEKTKSDGSSSYSSESSDYSSSYYSSDEDEEKPPPSPTSPSTPDVPTEKKGLWY